LIPRVNFIARAMKIIPSLTLKLILSYLLIILFSFGFVAVFLERNLEKDMLQERKVFLVHHAALFSNQISRRNFVLEDPRWLENFVVQQSAQSGCRITLVSKQGKVLADSEKRPEQLPGMDSHANRPEIRTALSGGTGVEARYSLTSKKNMLYVAVPFQAGDGVLGVVRLSLPLTQVENTVVLIRKTVVSGGLIALGLVLILGLYFITRTIRPIKQMIQVSQKISDGDFSSRVIPMSHDEIRDLALTLNTMAQHIEDKIKELNTRNQELAAIFNSMGEGVVVTDKGGGILSINPAMERIFGINNLDVRGRPFLEAIRNNDLAEVLLTVLREGQPVSREIYLLLPVRKTFQMNAVPIFEGGVINGCLAVIHDITDIKRLETMRRDFVANVSHELKTPLTTIKGFVETLLGGALDDRKNNRAFLKIIQNHTERLHTLVNDLLSLALFESQASVFHFERTPLRSLADNALADAQPQWQKKSLTVKNDVPPDLFVLADKDKLSQVFSNLIENAVKFNRDNGVLTVFCQDLTTQVKVYVEDTGIGIPEKDLLRIFERFYRVDKARSRQMGGTGLGLSIVKHIIEKHQGTVGVESTEGLGSRFWFTLMKA